MGLFDRFRKNHTNGRHAGPTLPQQGPKAAPRATSQAPDAGSLFDIPAPAPAAPASERPRTPAPGTAPAPGATTARPPAASPDTLTAGVHQVGPNAQWYGPGTTAYVNGTALPGGMLYVGRSLAAPDRSPEPALINPTLKVDTRSPDLFGSTMGYWPAYGDISPRARGAYLNWLAGGRTSPTAYIGYVFLFFYGLERRALVDIARNPQLRWELPHLRAEVTRLLDLYGDNSSFRGYATRFLDVLDFQNAEHGTAIQTPPLTRTALWEPPASLLIELGSFAADGKPLPAAWALAWAWYHPEVHLRTPAFRCTDEFADLFKRRYADAHRDGLTIRATKTPVKVEYWAASAGIRSVTLTMDGVPHVFNQATVVRKLATLADSACADLDAYSRYLGRNPEGRDTLTAAALLPADLTGEPTGALADLRNWATAAAETGTPTTGAQVFAHWETKSPERMAKAEAVTLAQLLERFGLGIEPDVRLGGPAITPATPVVVFRTGAQPPSTATPAYTAATTLLHLATAVAAADGHVAPEEQQHLVDHLESSLDLSPGERTRLGAHLRWLAANGVKLTGLTKRVAGLEPTQRAAFGDLLVGVAAADGVISPDEITTLTKIYKLIDLDPADVHSRLHAHLTGAASRPAPATAPVTVREAGEADAGYPITPPAANTAGGRHRAESSDGVGAGATAAVALDLAAIEAKLAETAAVSALLADIFADDDPDAHRSDSGSPVQAHAHAANDPVDGAHQGAGIGAPPPSSVPSIAGLDAAHSAFLRALAERPTWTRGELANLAAEWNLMPDGAVDRINEAALDASDEPFLDEDDDLFTVNDYARGEMLP